MTDRSRRFPPESLPLQPLPVQELRLLDGGARWRVDQFLPELPSLTPIRGTLTAIHAGPWIQLSGEGRTRISLRCDRCLDHFSHPLQFRCTELVALNTEASSSRLQDDAAAAEPIDCLDPAGCFDPTGWFLEQLNLQWPCRNDCGVVCQGPGPLLEAPPPPDPRWAPLIQLSQLCQRS